MQGYLFPSAAIIGDCLKSRSKNNHEKLNQQVFLSICHIYRPSVRPSPRNFEFLVFNFFGRQIGTNGGRRPKIGNMFRTSVNGLVWEIPIKVRESRDSQHFASANMSSGFLRKQSVQMINACQMCVCVRCACVCVRCACVLCVTRVVDVHSASSIFSFFMFLCQNFRL